VGAEVDYAMGCLGSEDEGHKTIVTSGPRTALANTSGHITDREIREGDLVVVDTGATVKGYRTDLGRAYVVGKPTPRQQEIHRLVRGAWKAAFQAVRPGAIADDLDVAARKVLGNYEQYFNQEAGHGIGLSFEPPFLGKGRKDVLKENMVLAVEIGLYMDDFGGILIEDTVLVTKSGAECLTTVSSGWPK
jgi:Xaa-Pro aminopeptidase